MRQKEAGDLAKTTQLALYRDFFCCHVFPVILMCLNVTNTYRLVFEELVVRVQHQQEMCHHVNLHRQRAAGIVRLLLTGQLPVEKKEQTLRDLKPLTRKAQPLGENH